MTPTLRQHWERYEKMPIRDFFATAGASPERREEMLHEVLFLVGEALRSMSHTRATPKMDRDGKTLTIELCRGHLPAKITVWAQPEAMHFKFESPCGPSAQAFTGSETFGDLVDALYHGPMLDWFRRVGV